MSSFMLLISKAWRCMSASRHFIGVLKPIEESNYLGYNKRGYITGNGKLGSKDEIDNGNNNSRGHRSFESSGRFQSQNHDIHGRKPTMSRLRVKSRKRGFRDGFRMPDFDPGKDQLKKIFESQMDISDPIVELDLGDGGPIEGNFRDDDDSRIFIRSPNFQQGPEVKNQSVRNGIRESYTAWQLGSLH